MDENYEIKTLELEGWIFSDCKLYNTKEQKDWVSEEVGDLIADHFREVREGAKS